MGKRGGTTGKRENWMEFVASTSELGPHCGISAKDKREPGIAFHCLKLHRSCNALVMCNLVSSNILLVEVEKEKNMGFLRRWSYASGTRDSFLS